MDKIGYLIVVLVTLLSTIHAIYWSYTHLKKGKMQSIYLFDHSIYSFKNQHKEAYNVLLFNCIMSALGIIIWPWFFLGYFHISWNFKSNLFIGLITSALGIFTFYYINKYIKKGEASLYGWRTYSFKKQPKEAYLLLLLSCFIGVLSIFVGILFLLVNK